MRKGFTLVELMIVIAIIAIIIAIAIPNLLSGRISANETSAIGTLKQFTSTEAIWLQQGPDGNGMKDYWTYDISAMHRMLRADGTNKVAFIPIDIAQADARCLYDGALPFGGNPAIDGDWTDQAIAKWQPKSGYWFTVMDYMDISDLTATGAYNQNEVVPGDPASVGANFNKYAFMAAPDTYGSSGVRSFIVSEAGVIYGADLGYSAANGSTVGCGFGTASVPVAPGTVTADPKWETINGGTILTWPGQNPNIPLVGVNGNRTWASAE
jgi:prepilin-type N-terminal cleavage/methylation domain-containing protein